MISSGNWTACRSLITYNRRLLVGVAARQVQKDATLPAIINYFAQTKALRCRRQPRAPTIFHHGKRCAGWCCNRLWSVTLTCLQGFWITRPPNSRVVKAISKDLLYWCFNWSDLSKYSLPVCLEKLSMVSFLCLLTIPYVIFFLNPLVVLSVRGKVLCRASLSYISNRYHLCETAASCYISSESSRLFRACKFCRACSFCCE